MSTIENAPIEVGLETILITDELVRRVARRPDLVAENAAFQRLGRLMATRPDALLPALVQYAIELCHADTAGVSLVARSETGENVFRWVELAGALVAYEGVTTPRHFSPCGVTLDRNAPQLFDRPGRLFTYLNQAPLPILEGLVVPLGTIGPALGTLWIVTHHEDRHFDAEDVRVMANLVDFTAAALQLTQSATENIRLSQEAREALRLRNEAISTLSHDLRNPLAGIKSQAQLLVRRFGHPQPPPLESVIASLASIAGAAQRMDQQIGEMADLVLLSSGHPLSLHLQSVDLVTLTRAIVREHQMGTERHSFRLDCPEAELRGEWDLDRVMRCLDNLLSNAVKFSPNGGAIVVTLVRDGDWTTLSVLDHGVGIPDVDQGRVFERFFRARNVQKKIDGSGLGLRGVRDIIEAHGGTVLVQSTEGVGTTVTLRLPRVAVVPDVVREVSERSARCNGRTGGTDSN